MSAKIHINLDKFKKNVEFLTDKLHESNINVFAVSKVFCAEKPLIDILNNCDIAGIADSRILNLKKIKTNKSKMLLRIPAISEVSDVIEYADISLNSEIAVIRELNDFAKRKNVIHKIILMIDLGDLREGIYFNDFDYNIINEIRNLKNIKLLGIGTNLTCYGAVIPTKQTYELLNEIKNNIEKMYKIKLEVISGGNSSSIYLLDGKIPDFINQLRIGEGFVLGRETAFGRNIEGMHDDIFTLEVEIIELKNKPTIPFGEIGVDAFGRKLKYVDKGIIKRAILNIGKQDVSCEYLIPPKGVNIIGSSSDHLIVEIVSGKYGIGDKIVFKLNYGGILGLMTSSYVEKVYE
ncbi:MAG: alanine/ornithine racemase family PLP-dependent enzyme [Bacilli bacterium]|nr:alanine/ornithine racemase family PLP-dependent enzyme [Bacilli bacterium]